MCTWKLSPGETDQHCLPDMRQPQLPVLACSFRHHQFLQTFDVWQAHFARGQANVACSVLACQFRHTELVTGEKASKSDQAPNTDVEQTMLASFARPLMSDFLYVLETLS